MAVIIEHTVALLVIALRAMKLLYQISHLPSFPIFLRFMYFADFKDFMNFADFAFEVIKNTLCFDCGKRTFPIPLFFGLNWRGVVDLNSALAEAESEPIYLAIGYSTLSPL